MATFYVLPARHLLGQRFGEMLSTFFPGASFTPWDLPHLAESLASMIEERSGAFFIYREDLDEQMSVKESLIQQFGAAPDDEVIEIQLTAALQQRWAMRKAA